MLRVAAPGCTGCFRRVFVGSHRGFCMGVRGSTGCDGGTCGCCLGLLCGFSRILGFGFMVLF